MFAAAFLILALLLAVAGWTRLRGAGRADAATRLFFAAALCGVADAAVWGLAMLDVAANSHGRIYVAGLLWAYPLGGLFVVMLVLAGVGVALVVLKWTFSVMGIAGRQRK